MKKPIAFLALLLGLALAATAGSAQTPNAPAIRLLLNEVQPGSLSSSQYCTLVFQDHHFHSEKASRQHGKDTDRKIYEGELSEADWNALGAIIDSNEFRELKV